MSEIEKIKKLRQSTGAGFKDCNAALKESNGDLEKAVEILRVKGIAKPSTWLIIPCIPCVNNIPFNLDIYHYIAFI